MYTIGFKAHWRFKVWDPESGIVLQERRSENLRTTAGIDWMFGQIFSGSPVASKGFTFIALSTDTTGGTSASTTLTSEITTNGLGRAAGTYAHTTGSLISTLKHDFVCSGGGTVTVKSAALFTDSAAGTINHITAFSAIVVPSGWTLSVMVSITAGGSNFTFTGLDWAFAQAYSGTPTTSQGLNLIALSTAASGGNASFSALASEIVGTGLDRVASTYVHTGGTSTCTISHLFTYTGAGSAQLRSASVNYSAYPAASAGIIVSYALSAQASGVPFTVTFTVTLS